MVIRNWLTKAACSIDTLDAELIAMYCFAPEDSDRTWLALHEQSPINSQQLEDANILLKMRADGTPLAYLTHKKEFYGRKFFVTPDVLIPRPETEALIDLVKELDLPPKANILELGTGSGCIAITLALEFPQANVVATDISPYAIDIAIKNDLTYDGRVEFCRADLFYGLDRIELDKCDVIIANLPYVSPRWDWLDKDSLIYEPSYAIYDSGRNGLSLYRRFFQELSEYSVRSNYLVLEADPCQHHILVRHAKAQGYKLLKISGFGLLFMRNLT